MSPSKSTSTSRLDRGAEAVGGRPAPSPVSAGEGFGVVPAGAVASWVAAPATAIMGSEAAAASYVPRLLSQPSTGLVGAAAVIMNVADVTPAHMLPSTCALESDSRKVGAVERLPGAIVFVDVSGFTKLANAMLEASDGRAACEELTRVLSEYVSRLVRCLHEWGLDILFFAGDSVVGFAPTLPDDEVPAAAVVRGAAAALSIQRVVFERDGFTLRAHTGIGCGELHAYAVQAASARHELLFAGSALKGAIEAQRASRNSDIVASPSAWEQLRGRAAGRPLAGHDSFWLVDGFAPRGAPEAPGAISSRWCACGAALAAGLRGPAAAFRELGASPASFLPAVVAGGAADTSLRSVTAVFAAFPALDLADGPDDDAAAARHAEACAAVVRRVHAAAEAEFGGCVCKFLQDDKGATVLVVFGLPGGFTHEDDPERAVHFALAMQQWLDGMQQPFACGIASGRIFCGRLGAACRQEYATIGEAVNRAARLMALAKGESPSSVLCDERVAEAGRSGAARFEVRFQRLPPVLLKGYSHEVNVFRPAPANATGRGRLSRPSAPAALSTGSREEEAAGSEAGDRRSARYGGGPEQPVAGRAAELRALRAAVGELLLGRGCSLVLRGPAGHGKSALLEAAASEVARVGGRVLVARGSPLHRSVPFAALRSVLVCAGLDLASEAALGSDLARRGSERPLQSARLLLQFVMGHKPEASAPAEEGDAAVRTAFGRAQAIARLFVRIVHSVASGPVALLVEDAHFLCSASWAVLRELRKSCPGALLVLATRPMCDPPRELAYLCGDAAERCAQRPAGAPSRASSPRASLAAPPSVASLHAPRLSLSSPGQGAPRRLASPFSPGLSVHSRPATDPEPAASPVPPLHSNGSQPSPPPAAPPYPAGFDEAGPRRSADREPAAAAARAPAPEVPVRLFDLGPLSDREAYELVQARLGDAAGRFGREALAAVVEKSGGVPLFLVELSRQLLLVGEAAAAAVPSSIEGVVLARVDRLPRGAQALLRLAAVVGPVFTLEAAVAADPRRLSEGEARAALEELVAAALVGPLEGGEHRFVTALVRDAVYEATPHAARQRMHLNVAVWLEARGQARDGSPTPSAAESAALYHHIRASGDVVRALTYLEQAAGGAYHANALKEARDGFRELHRQLDALGLDSASPARPDPLRIRVPRVRWCRVQDEPPDSPGPPSSPPPKRATGRSRGSQAAADPLQWRAMRLRSLRQWCFAEYHAGRLDIGLELATRLLAACGHALPKGPAALAARVAAMIARDLLLRPLPEPVPFGPPAGGANEGPAAGEADLAAVWEVLAWLAVVTGDSLLGVYAALRAYRTAACVKGGVPRDSSAAPVLGRMQAMLAFVTGLMRRHALSDRLLANARAIGEALDDDSVRGAAEMQRGMRAASFGRMAEAREAFAAATRLNADVGAGVCGEAWGCSLLAALSLGELEEARAGIAECWDFSRRVGSRQLTLYLAVTLAWASWLQGDDEGTIEWVLRGNDVKVELGEGGALWWIEASLLALEGLAAWRYESDVRKAARLMAASTDLWRANVLQSLWFCSLQFYAVVDFRLWCLHEAQTGEPAGPPRTAPVDPEDAGAGSYVWSDGPRMAAAVCAAGRPRALRAAEEAVGLLRRSARLLPGLAPHAALAAAELARVRAGGRPTGAWRRALQRASAAFARGGHRLMRVLVEAKLGAVGGPSDLSATGREAAGMGVGLRALREGADPCDRPLAGPRAYVPCY